MARVKIPRKENPMVKGKLWWVWVFLLPIAFILWIYFELREDHRISRIKKSINKRTGDNVAVIQTGGSFYMYMYG